MCQLRRMRNGRVLTARSTHCQGLWRGGGFLKREAGGGVTVEGEGNTMGWKQPEPGSAEACKLASWYNSHRQIFFLPSRKDFPGLPFLLA